MSFISKRAVLVAVLISCISNAPTFASIVPGEILVQIKNHETSHRLEDSVRSLLGSRLGRDSVSLVRPFSTDSRIAKIRLTRSEELKKAIRILKESKKFLHVEPNLVHSFQEVESDSDTESESDEATGLPDDPKLNQLWGLKNSGQKISGGTAGKVGSDLHVQDLWAHGKVGSREVIVAIVDGGVDWTHPDLVANLYTNKKEIPGNGLDDDHNGFIDDVHGWNFAEGIADSQDSNGHGTHIAGTIGAVGNNHLGVVGVNWKVSLLPVKCFDPEGYGTTEDTVQAIQYAVKMKAQVLNVSWGSFETSDILKGAILDSAQAGVVFVAAAGNVGTDNDLKPYYPASYDVANIISVAATDNWDQLASFSQYGKKSVHVAAPGVGILSTVPSSLFGGEAYYSLNGTSMATPHVAGVAALMRSVDPDLSFKEIKRRLIETSDPVRALKRKIVSGGRINAANAVHDVVPKSDFPKENAWNPIEGESIESTHPTVSSQTILFPFQYPGARFIRFHLEKVEIEKDSDSLKIFEGNSTKGEMIDDVSGCVNGCWTEYIRGGQAVIELKTDDENNGWGFRIDQIQIIQ